jgi:hypothetical protein
MACQAARRAPSGRIFAVKVNNVTPEKGSETDLVFLNAQRRSTNITTKTMITSVTKPPPIYMITLPFETIQGSRLGRCTYFAALKNKKPTWRKTRRNSTTSAYSLANHPGRTGLFFI